MSGSIYDKDRKTKIPGRTYLTIPMPVVAPLWMEVDDPQFVQDVWDAFVQPDIDAGKPQSAEMRVLMGILRAVYAGLSER